MAKIKRYCGSYILEIERENQSYGLYFPCYELGVIERFTGLMAVSATND